MTTAKKTRWTLQGDYYQACSCDYGCPCEFEAPPTQGFCDGIGAWRISKGRYGSVSLDGVALGFAAHWPGPIHKGNGTIAVLVDEKATPKQREALLEIAFGKAGGMPFEIIVQTVTKALDPQFMPFQFSGRGRNASVKMGNAASIALEPIKNPITGELEDVKVVHSTGSVPKWLTWKLPPCYSSCCMKMIGVVLGIIAGIIAVVGVFVILHFLGPALRPFIEMAPEPFRTILHVLTTSF